MWAIWKRRNLWVFEKKLMEFPHVLDMVSMNVSNMQSVQPQIQNVQRMLAKWECPEINVYKANVDAVVSSNTGVGLGVFFRNHEGEVMATATSMLPHTRDPLLAESLAINWAMKIAHQLIFTRMW
ncbi:Reverse transcriptase-like [Sesbania bispinosa]|nr:Reverse transcriptase-like [Sesbania bispinosa]